MPVARILESVIVVCLKESTSPQTLTAQVPRSLDHSFTFTSTPRNFQPERHTDARLQREQFRSSSRCPGDHAPVPDAPKTKLLYESTSFTGPPTSVSQRVTIAIYRQGDFISQFVFLILSCLFILSRSLAERLPPHPPPRTPPCRSQINAPIGFLLHVAFPSSKIHLYLSVHESPLRGLLPADLVGFPATSYAYHFRQTISHISARDPPKIEGTFRSGISTHKTGSVFSMGTDVDAPQENMGLIPYGPDPCWRR